MKHDTGKGRKNETGYYEQNPTKVYRSMDTKVPRKTFKGHGALNGGGVTHPTRAFKGVK